MTVDTHETPNAPRKRLPWQQIALAGSFAAVLRTLLSGDGGWGTLLVVNLLGCALLGVLIARGRATPALAGGFCGGLTTFSGVMLQAQATAQGRGIGAVRATSDTLALPGGAVGTITLLSLTSITGLAAFIAARRLARPSTLPTPPQSIPAEPAA